MFNSKYNRDRPFLVINIIKRPAKKSRTSVPNWGEQENAWDIFEQPYVVDNVTNKVMNSASVIIDVLQSRVIKSHYNDATPEQLVEYYVTKYQEQIQEAMKVWLERMAKIHGNKLLENIPEEN